MHNRPRLENQNKSERDNRNIRGGQINYVRYTELKELCNTKDLDFQGDNGGDQLSQDTFHSKEKTPTTSCQVKKALQEAGTSLYNFTMKRRLRQEQMQRFHSKVQTFHKP